MQIKQWENKHLSHFSYAIMSDCEKRIVLIDPARNPEPYITYAAEHDAQIIGVIETHPHADFVSSHFELHQTTGAIIYASKRTEAQYPHQPFDEGHFIQFGKIKLYPLNTPGHSPDSISIVLEHQGASKAVFTGDTLFVGDCGRPDLREEEGKEQSEKENLARQMYYSLRGKLVPLGDDVMVYPAHGAGTLCGKSLSDAKSSTIGEEKKSNWCLQEMSEKQFIKKLLEDQPFVPAYFPYDVALNKKGAGHFKESVSKVRIGNPVINKSDAQHLQKDIWIIDARDEKVFKKGHLHHSINIMDENKFETWLGSIIHPEETFYLTAAHEVQLKNLIERVAAIGYETKIEEAFVLDYTNEQMDQLNINEFKKHPDAFTIIDVRNESEVKEDKIFPQSISIPLAALRQRVDEVPMDQPIVVHCAGGFRSAAASSILQSQLNGRVKVYDLGEAVKDFIKQ